VIRNLETWLRGTFPGVSPKHLPRYLDEFVHRLDRRWREDELGGLVLRRAARAAPPSWTSIRCCGCSRTRSFHTRGRGSTSGSPGRPAREIAHRRVARSGFLLPRIAGSTQADGAVGGRVPVTESAASIASSAPVLIIRTAALPKRAARAVSSRKCSSWNRRARGFSVRAGAVSGEP
jgi:hypothetical protein